MSTTPADAGAAVPQSQKGTWTSFVKSLASWSGDLSSMTAPPFILSPVSLTEFPAYWSERPGLFAAIADGKTEADRATAVLKWFISTLKGQYTSRNETMGSEKKPLNPVLGEYVASAVAFDRILNCGITKALLRLLARQERTW
ncbi:Oxysterol binding protein [Ceratobasidium sp. 394]|nr:Oxysterol binding protein [Ceratobasidium sp. 394]